MDLHKPVDMNKVNFLIGIEFLGLPRTDLMEFSQDPEDLTPEEKMR